MDEKYLRELQDAVTAYAKGITDGAKIVLDSISNRLKDNKDNGKTVVEADTVPAEASK